MLPQQIQLQVRQDSICQISAASIKNGINGRIQKGICEIGCPCSCRCRTSRLGLPYRGENSNGKRSCLQLAANPGNSRVGTGKTIGTSNQSDGTNQAVESVFYMDFVALDFAAMMLFSMTCVSFLDVSSGNVERNSMVCACASSGGSFSIRWKNA